MAWKVPSEDETRRLASDRYHRDGECEIDYQAPVSFSDDGDGIQGAYVQAWVYVEFEEIEDEYEETP